MSTFNDEQKATLRGLLNNHLFREAMDNALGEVWRLKAGAEGLEANALANAYKEGSTAVLSALFKQAGETREPAPKPARLNHRA
jgi:hypothetical protein